MHREFAAVCASLKAFVDQPDDPTLLMEMSDHDLVPVLKMFQTLDETNRSAVFLLFPFACDSVEDYAQQGMAALAQQIAHASQSRETAGETGWRPLPLTCTDPRQPVAVRLRAAIEHVRTLVPRGVDIVWAWLPSSLGDAAGFAKLMLPLLALDGVDGWMEGHRFCIRDARERPALIPFTRERKAAHVLILTVDFSSSKAARSLAVAAEDAGRPMGERVQALMQLAAIDLAHGRFPAAREKYRVLHAWHERANDAVNSAQALHGLGDVALRQGSVGEARQWYGQALERALEGQHLMVVLNALMAMGECSNRLAEPARAAIYFELASTGAGRLMLPRTKVEAMEKLGTALLACCKPEEAARQWVDAKGLCERFGCERLRIAVLGRLASLYAKAGLKTEARAYELQMKSPPARSQPDMTRTGAAGSGPEAHADGRAKA